MPMYFVQHGLSVAKEIDPERPLSDDGRKNVELAATHLRKMGVAVKSVCHSGKTRARQTAEILAGQIALNGISEQSGMAPNDSAVEFAAALEDDTMYVGHLPHVGKLVSYLVVGDEDAGVVQFVNGGVVCIENDDAGSFVEWYLRPSMCNV
jgi:phosphohistidine phosphatase